MGGHDNNNGHRDAACRKNHLQDKTYCEKREKSYVKPFLYYFFHILLPLPVVSLIELEWNPLEWSVYTHLAGAVWVCYATIKLLKVLNR